MSEKQLDLELDATGIQPQIDELAMRAYAMWARWMLTFDHEAKRSTIPIEDNAVLAVLNQAMAVQDLLDMIWSRQAATRRSKAKRRG